MLYNVQLEGATMQFGIFTVGDVTPDPTTGRAPSEARADRVDDAGSRSRPRRSGLDVFATGEHHNPPFVASVSPTTHLGFIAAKTEKLLLSTATTLITTNDPVKIAEDYAMLQHLSGGRVDLMMGRGNTGPVYPWFGKDIRDGIKLAVENYHLLRKLWREPVVNWQGQFRTPLQGFTATPGAARRHAALRVARVDPQPRDRRAGGLLRRRLLPQPHLLEQGAHRADGEALPPAASSTTATAPPTRPSSASVARCSWRTTEAEAKRFFRPYFDNAPVYGHGPSLEDFTELTPLTVGTPEQVIERTLGFADYVGDYQRQLFLMDHAGLPIDVVLEQLEILGREVVPVLRAEFDRRRPAHVPERPAHPRLAGRGRPRRPAPPRHAGPPGRDRRRRRGAPR